MKVSVVIPVYNVAPYIERCLQSVVSQTCQCFECLLIDDCGTDGSMHFIEQFIWNYEGAIHFSILRHQHNMGPSAARNTGIKAAKGSYIYFMDSDDSISPDCIGLLLRLAEKYPEADYVQGNIVTGSENLMEGCIDSDVPEYCDDKQQLESIILCKSHRTAWNRLLKRSFLLDKALFFPVGLVMEDHYWNYFVAKYAHAAAFTHQGTYYYYNNSGSIVNSRSKQHFIKNYTAYMTAADVITNDLSQQADILQCHRQYLGETIVFCMTNLARLHSLPHWWEFWKMACSIAYRLRAQFTWRNLFFFFCMMPPLCLMTDIKGWRWRLRTYIVVHL